MYKMAFTLFLFLLAGVGFSGAPVDSSSNDKALKVSPTVTAGVYVANDQVGGIQTLSNVADTDDKIALLQTVGLLDKAGNSTASYTIFFFSELPTVTSSDHAALNISDAEMLKCIGVVTVTPSSTTASNSYGTTQSALKLKSTVKTDAQRVLSGNLYAVVKTTSTPTFTSTSDLQFYYGFAQ